MPGKVEFKANVPVEVALQFPQGCNVPSNFGDGTQVMYTTVDGRKMYLAPYVAKQIAAAKPQPGSRFRITKSERTDGRKGFDWSVESLEGGAQLDGTYVVPKADFATSPEITKPASDDQRFISGSSSPQGSTAIAPQNITEMPSRKGPTAAEAHCYRLVDLTAATMRYAKERHGGIVREDDARAIAITVYIQAGRSGRLRWKPVQDRRVG